MIQKKVLGNWDVIKNIITAVLHDHVFAFSIETGTVHATSVLFLLLLQEAVGNGTIQTGIRESFASFIRSRHV